MGSVPVGRKKRADAASGPQTFRSPTAVIVWWVWLLFAVANLIDLAVQGRDRVSLVAAAILVLATGIAYVTAQRPRIIADSAGITIVNPLRDHHIGWAGVTQVDLADLLRVHCRRGPDDTKVIYSWAVHYSRRRKLAADVKARRTAARMSSGRSSFGTFGLGAGGRRGLWRRRPPRRGYGSTAAAKPPRRPRRKPSGSSGCSASTRPRPGPRRSGPRAPWRSPAPARLTRPRAGRPRSQRGRGRSADLRIAGWLEPLKSTWSRPALLALLIPALILLVIVLV